MKLPIWHAISSHGRWKVSQIHHAMILHESCMVTAWNFKRKIEEIKLETISNFHKKFCNYNLQVMALCKTKIPLQNILYGNY